MLITGKVGRPIGLTDEGELLKRQGITENPSADTHSLHETLPCAGADWITQPTRRTEDRSEQVALEFHVYRRMFRQAHVRERR